MAYRSIQLRKIDEKPTSMFYAGRETAGASENFDARFIHKREK